jgi:DNA primase
MQLISLLQSVLLASLALTSVASPIPTPISSLTLDTNTINVLDARAKATTKASTKVTATPKPTAQVSATQKSSAKVSATQKSSAKVSATQKSSAVVSATQKSSAIVSGTQKPSATVSASAKPSSTPAFKLATIAECKAQMKVAKDTTLFYSVVRSQVARDTIASSKYPHLKGYMTLRSRWNDPKWPDKYTVGVDDATAKKFWDTASTALTEMTTGTAYVLLPKGKGTDWKKGTVWDRAEWPNVPKGLKIIRINPDDPNDQEVIKA